MHLSLHPVIWKALHVFSLHVGGLFLISLIVHHLMHVTHHTLNSDPRCKSVTFCFVKSFGRCWRTTCGSGGRVGCPVTERLTVLNPLHPNLSLCARQWCRNVSGHLCVSEWLKEESKVLWCTGRCCKVLCNHSPFEFWGFLHPFFSTVAQPVVISNS